VNCKNTKRKTIKNKRINGTNNIDLEKSDLISREEIYFAGKENIEGFSCILNFFIKSLSTCS